MVDVDYVGLVKRVIPNSLRIVEDVYSIAGLEKIRTGWKLRGYFEESIREHCMKVGLACFFVSGNIDLAYKGLSHDMGEGYDSVDVSPHCGISPEEKYLMELRTMRRIRDEFQRGYLYYQYWNELEEKKSPEDLLLKDLDKICPVIESLKYGSSDLTYEFRNSVLKKVNNDKLISIMLKVEKEFVGGVDPYLLYFDLLRKLN